jgi:hypothetical protein
MRSREILNEVEELRRVSDRLLDLADQNRIMSDGLLKISTSIRNSALLLEVMVRIKMAPLPEDLGLANT